MNKKKKLMLIDGNSLFFRAYYGSAYNKNGLLTTSKNVPINGVFTFIRMIFNLIKNYEPTHIAVAFDTGKPTKRHESFVGYKANRSQVPQELIVQFPIVYEFLENCNIKYFALEGYEADDILATFSLRYLDEFEEVEVVSSDKDLFQLVNEKVSVLSPQNKNSVYKKLSWNNFFEEVQILPKQIIDYKGLVGDPSDNLPGVKGIGPKTAIKLINEYGSLEKIYDNINAIPETIAKKLIEGEKSAFVCKIIATLDFSTPIFIDKEELFFNNFQNDNLINFYKKYDLVSFLKNN